MFLWTEKNLSLNLLNLFNQPNDYKNIQTKSYHKIQRVIFVVSSAYIVFLGYKIYTHKKKRGKIIKYKITTYYTQIDRSLPTPK